MSKDNPNPINDLRLQMSTNCSWLMEKIDRIHELLCPGKTGTWQQQAEQVLETAKHLHSLEARPTKLTNFCRVFELPQSYPEDYCFDGGHPVMMRMVDWFNPWPTDFTQPTGLADKTWTEVWAILEPFLKEKCYIRPNRKYLVITDFGKVALFSS